MSKQEFVLSLYRELVVMSFKKDIESSHGFPITYAILFKLANDAWDATQNEY